MLHGCAGDLPSGTVTFLFTDVEGSTRLLQELGAEGYAEALAEHRRLIREACAGSDGVEVDTQGDAFFFSFPTAPGALAAAQEMTEALASGPIQVRVGLHTGTPLLTEEGYVGDDVHFGARVAACGHGGQVLLSAPTIAAIDPSNRLLLGDSILDLGEHRLKDIESAVSIFQLGEGSFPPLKTISNTNLPRPASSFVGRGAELREVLSRIEQGARLLTLSGPGGTGKTRLALEAVATLVPEYKAGVFWVGFASLRDPALVTETISQTLGAKDGLAEHIGERELLLLLDNLEQVVEAAPELSALLSACPNLTLLVTSREVLRVQGEVEYAVPPLASPEAVSLFCARSQLEPSEEIAELCARLDNLPLAVELAAGRAKALSPKQILERLSQRLDLLQGGRDADPRQQTLRATIEWSYDLLSPPEQELFARLSVFAGGCTFQAAEEVSDADLDTLQSLVEKSLLRFTDERYWMLETIRAFASERVGTDAGTVQRTHAMYYARVAAAQSDPLVMHLLEAYATLTDEQDNMRAALSFVSERRLAAVFGDLLYGLWRYWLAVGSGAEARQWATRYLADGRDATPLERFAGDLASGEILRFTGDAETAAKLKRESVDVVRANPDAIVHGRAIGRWTAAILSDLSHIERDEGRLEEARAYADEALVLRRERGEPAGLAHALAASAMIAYTERDFAAARSLFAESDACWLVAERHEDAAMASLAVAECDVLLGCLDNVAPRLEIAVETLRKEPDVGSAIYALRVAAMLAAAKGDAEHCVTMFGLADRLETESGMTQFSRVEDEVQRSYLEHAQGVLGEGEFQAAHATGAQVPDERSFEIVLAYLASVD